MLVFLYSASNMWNFSFDSISKILLSCTDAETLNKLISEAPLKVLLKIEEKLGYNIMLDIEDNCDDLDKVKYLYGRGAKITESYIEDVIKHQSSKKKHYMWLKEEGFIKEEEEEEDFY